MNVTMTEHSMYDDNQDIIWPTIVGIFVTLALGWMICRYKCSSNEQSPHVVQCCPKSLCQNIRLCCRWIFRLNNKSSQHSIPDSRMSMNSKGRSSNNSTMETSFMINNSRLFLTNLNQHQRLTFPFIAIQSNVVSSQPKQHPLRRESLVSTIDNIDQGRESSPWPFSIINMDFHKQTKEIKNNDLFLST